MSEGVRVRAALSEQFPAEIGPERFRKRVMFAGVIVALLGVGALLLARNWAEVRGWLGQIWTLIAAVPPAYVLLACGLKGLEVALNTSAWVTVLHSAYPEQSVTFRQALGVVQGSIGIATIIPPKVSGVPILGLYRARLPGSGHRGADRHADGARLDRLSPRACRHAGVWRQPHRCGNTSGPIALPGSPESSRYWRSRRQCSGAGS